MDSSLQLIFNVLLLLLECVDLKENYVFNEFVFDMPLIYFNWQKCVQITTVS